MALVFILLNIFIINSIFYANVEYIHHTEDYLEILCHGLFYSTS
jgi:uncharacterized sporulation protein YeaH/YhbH (DUF444 family)